MTNNTQPTLLVGEVCLDFTMPSKASEAKIRLGGVVHAARAMWAAGLPYSVAMVCPAYLGDMAKDYLLKHGCSQVITLGEIVGAPNVIAIQDVREIGHQGYEDLLRHSKWVAAAESRDPLDSFSTVVIFPGKYDLDDILQSLGSTVNVTIDVAYDVDGPDALRRYKGRFRSLVISTSSKLFADLGSTDIAPLVALAMELGAETFLLKENRGGSRLFEMASNRVYEIPAVLGETVNSVGVGDAFTAVFGAWNAAPVTAAWRGMQVATAYSQTTFPDDLHLDVQRELALSIDVVEKLGGVQLSWHSRTGLHIYLAAPDFSYTDKPEIDAAVAALNYHNFTVRRPILENGEAPRDASAAQLQCYYDADVTLLDQCAVVFAIPLGRDPGTLVEMGMAMARGTPVITYDPRAENANTMVVCGSRTYSNDLDASLNGLFSILSQIENDRK